MTSARTKAYLLLILVSIIWGLAGPVIKLTLAGIPTLPFLTYRFLLSSLAAVIIFSVTGVHLPRDKKTLFEILVYAFLTSTVALGLLFFGLEKTTVLDMTLISAVNPLIIALAGVVLLNEHLTRREKLGMTIAFAGTMLTIFEPLLQNGIDGSQLSGNLLVLLSLFVNTASAILVKKLMRKGISPITLTSISFIVGFLTTTPFALSASGPELVQVISSLPLSYHLGVAYMALLSGNLAYVLWARAQKTIEVGEAGLFAYLYPIFSAPLAVWWLKEKITLPFILGALVIALGVYLAERRPRSIITS